MAMVESTMLDLGFEAPSFELPDPRTGRTVRLEDVDRGNGLLVMIICNHCPFVRNISHELVRFGEDYGERGLGIVAVNPNDPEIQPEDAPDRMAEVAEEQGYTFPYLFDGTQEVAKAYHAACTPDFFLFDRDRKLVYRGQFDDSRPGNGIPPTGEALRVAADLMLDGRPVPEQQAPSVGCSIKWSAGNEPEYLRSRPESSWPDVMEKSTS